MNKVSFWAYKPVIAIYLGSVLFSVVWTWLLHGSFNAFYLVQNFMACFLLVFASIKLHDIPGFATRFSTYDLIAKRVKFYGYLYPFLEFLLGSVFILYMHTLHRIGDYAMGVLAIIGIISVYLSIVKKQRLYCACLGTSFDLPLSYVAIIENCTMLFASIFMLLATVPASHLQ